VSAITVSMAYWHCAAYIERAVHSILEQTHRELRLVVIGDGEHVPPLPTDPRLVVLDLPVNRGPYYCDAVALAACGTEWFTIHAADDWSEPDRFARLLAASRGVDAVFGGSLEHRGDWVRRRPTGFDHAGDELRHVGSIATGIYRTEALRRVGGPHPEYRVVYDTMMVHLVLRALAWRHVDDEFGYHRVVRADSLTRSPATGLDSAYREGFRERRDALWDRVIARPVEEWPELLRPAADVLASVERDAARLRELQAEAEAVAA
jgi:Glycosyl transferase family 2